MLIKDYAVTKKHYPILCPDYEPLTTCQAIKPHDRNRSRHRVIENSLKIGRNHSQQRVTNEPLKGE